VGISVASPSDHKMQENFVLYFAGT